MTAVALKRVIKNWSDGSTAISIDDLEIGAGEFFGLIGPSGSGKSTLLRIIAGLTKPDEGDVLFDGRSVLGLEPNERRLGYMVQEGNLYPTMTVEDNIGFPLNVERMDKSGRIRRVEKHAGKFGLQRLLGKRPRELSAGYQHLTAASRATVRDTQLLLMDEPMTGLDTHIRERLRSQLRELVDSRLTIIYATNDQSEVFALADRIAVMEAGRLRQVGPPLELYRSPADVFVARFIGDPPMNVVAAEVGRDGMELRLGSDAIALTTPAPLGGTCLVGIRAEDGRPATPGTPFDECLHVTVTHVERLGEHDVAHTAFGGPDSGALDFTVRLAAGHPFKPGGMMELHVDVAKLVYFDPATGKHVQ